VRPELLYSAMNEIVSDGQSMRITNMETALELNDVLETNLFKSANSEGIPASTGFVSYINQSVVRYINDPVIRGSTKIGYNLHEFFKREFDAYNTASERARGFYDGSNALQELVHKITNSSINNQIKNKVLSLSSAIRTDNQEIISHQLQRLKAHTKNLSEEDMETYSNFVLKMDPASYFALLETANDYEFEAHSAAKAGKFTPAQLRKLQSIVDLNVDGTFDSNTAYNISQAGFSSGKLNAYARRWVTARSIQKIGVDKFEAFKKNKKLMHIIKDIAFANSKIVGETPSLADLHSRDVGAVEEMSGSVRAFTADQARSLKNNDWVIIRPATESTLGVAYKKLVDSTYQESVFTTIKARTTDVSIPSSMAGKDGTLSVGDSHKLILKESDLKKIGVNNDPSQSLVRTMAHNMAIKDSENIRNMLLMKETYFDISEGGVKKLKKIMGAKNKDNPWFLGDLQGADYDALDDEIKAKYREVPVGISLSNVNGFDQKIKYVRKDIAYWLVGSSEKSLATSKEMQFAMRVTKNLVSAAKIGMVILNPVKIAIDNVSNVMYLGVRGVDPIFIAKNYANILEEFNSYKKAQNELLVMRMRSYGNPEKYAAKLAKMEKRLKKMPGQGFVDRGFINSMGSEIVLNADDPSSGFKHDVDDVLKAIFTKKDGSNNAVAAFIMRASKAGLNVDEVLEAISPVLGAVGAGKEFERNLNSLAERVRHIKSEDDIISYMHQFINSPGSEWSKLGAHMTDLSDVVAKETFYRYLIEEGYGRKAAEIEVIDSFPDYKEGMPTAVKQLSDVGILMYPSYWIRIQKSIYRMVKDRPVSFGTEMGVEAYFNVNNPQIWDQAIINKADSYFGLIHTPWEHWGMGTVFPTNALG
jgi:hypothetical protein